LAADIFINIGAAVLTSMDEDELWRVLSDPTFLRNVGIAAIVVVPVIVVLGIWQLIWLGCLAGTPGANRFGPDPRPPKLVPATPQPT